ncbi:hypothetical protein GJ496_010659 [Pomphorhynchus laevis]|nr:hypothetical protein GJ496_010659 [Pomphorhynchus laevis]
MPIDMYSTMPVLFIFVFAVAVSAYTTSNQLTKQQIAEHSKLDLSVLLQPSLILFHVDTCAQCREMDAIFNILSAEFDNTHFLFGKVNCADHPNLCVTLNTFPAMLWFPNGILSDSKRIFANDYNQLREIIYYLLNQ